MSLLLVLTVFGAIDVFHADWSGFSGRLVADRPIIKESAEGDFVDITFPESALDGDFGGPLVPSYRYLIELPQDGDADVQISSFSSYLIEIPAPLSPLQPPRHKDAATAPFILKQELYDSYEQPIIAEIIPLGVMRGRKLGALVIRPFAYDPSANTLEIRTNIEFRVTYDRPLTQPPARLTSRWADHLLGTTLLSPMSVPRVFDLPPQYLILTSNYFASHLNEFVQYKEQQGFIVTVATVDSIGADTVSIKNFVRNAYTTWDIPPDFVLIIGDVDRVPALRRGSGWSNYPTDQYYVMVDGSDYFPDIACGRMSVESLDELQAILDKTMKYGRFEFSETSWLRKVVLPACGTDGDYELCMGTHRYCASTHLPPSDFDVDTIFAYFGGTGADVIASVNSGAAVVDYSGHGLETEWSNPNVDIGDLPLLTNHGKFGLVISNACLTNRFNYTSSPCFGETWIRQPNKAAVAHIAGSASTYWDEDDWWQRTIFDAVFDYGYYAAASFMYRGCLEVELRGSSAADYYFHIYHVLGDPSMGFYWGEPAPIAVDLPLIIPVGLATLDIAAPESTIISVWSDMGTRGSAYSIGGVANIPLDPPPSAGDSIVVYCYRPNFYEPIWAKIPVAPLVAFSINPDSLIVVVHDTISVYVGDTLGIPIVGAKITIEGIALAETLFTDASGNAILPLTPIYSEVLKVTGFSPIGELTFVEYIPVGGGFPLMPISLEAGSPVVRIADSLAMGVPGEIGFESPSYPTLWCLRGYGVDTCATVTDSAVIHITPNFIGDLRLITAAEGYSLGYSTIRVANCAAPFTGSIGSIGGEPAGGMRIALYSAGSDTSTTDVTSVITSNASGSFSSAGAIRLGYYDLYISGFGWEDTVVTNHIHHVDGGYDFDVRRSNLNRLSVVATDEFGTPILAEIHVVRDNNVLLGYTRNGEITIDSLPSYGYKVHVAARDMAIYSEIVSLDGDTYIEAELSPARANVLLISIEDDLAADHIEADLIDFGLTVVRKNFVPALDTTFHYEFVIYSAGGGSDDDVCSEVTGRKLLEYRQAGINLLIEGGEIAYEYHNAAVAEVLDSLLMISNWFGDNPGANNLLLNPEPENALELARNPLSLPSIMAPRSIGYWDFFYFDIVAPTVSTILYTVGSSARAGVTYYPDINCQGLHRISHMFFKYDNALTTPYANQKALRNITEWLRPPDFEHGVLLARAWVPAGESGDIMVAGGGDTSMTDIDGKFRLQMEPGTHSIAFSAPHVADTVFFGISLDPGQIRTGDVFVLAVYGIDEVVKPGDYALTAVYPNPFNGRVAFDVQSPEQSEIEISIFDINGRMVHNEKIGILGKSTIVWDTSSDIELASGVYFYKIAFPNREIKGKVLLVK